MIEPTDSEERRLQQWVQGELLLAGTFDARLIRLFAAIEQTGSINQAAKSDKPPPRRALRRF